MAEQKFEIETPQGRQRAWRHYQWIDHAVLRYKWTNFDQIAPGAYRSNHPTHERLEEFKNLGGKTILSLRGAPPLPPYMFEKESCDALGLDIVAVGLAARKAPKKEELIKLLDIFDTIERPFLMHCKSGADRTGLASILYLMEQEGQPLDTLKEQLSFKYIHIRRSRTGILDHFFRVYAKRNAQSPIGIRDWITDEYNQEAFAADYETYRAGLKLWEGWR